MHKKRLVLWLFLSFFLILGSSSVGYLATSQSSSPDVCDFVERFEILNRSTRITLDDLPWIAELPSFGEATIENLKEEIQKNGPITSRAQLRGVDEVGEGKAFIVRIFFNLNGEETCNIDA